MQWLIWAGLLPGCVAAAAIIARRPARQVWEEMHVDRARALFRLRREWLEARFVGALRRIDPAEGRRWEDASWRDEIVWARDRQTRGFLALVGVHFATGPLDILPTPRHATAVFEFRKGALARRREAARRGPPG